MTKLKIDIKAGTIEVEGEKAFVKEIYEDYKDRIGHGAIGEADGSQPNGTEEATESKPQIKSSKRGKGVKLAGKGKRKESYSIITDVALSGGKDKESLKEFFAMKQPKTAQECAVVFVYYLKKTAKTPNVTVGHIYTCYRTVGERVPSALRQSLYDTASRRGWIDTKSPDDITVTVVGENYVELDLPKQQAK